MRLIRLGVRPGPLACFIATLLALGLAGCPKPEDTDSGPGTTDSGTGTVQCTDGIDNDADALIDFPNDPGCVDGADDDETQPPQCDDDLDNDGDSLTDLADPGCTSSTDTSEANPECSDGVDNDGDGEIDFPDDPDCIGFTDEREQEDPDCSDLADNDMDTLTDFPDDPGCTDANDPSESDLPDCAGLFVNDITDDGLLAGVSDAKDPSFFMGSCGGPGAEAIAFLDVTSQLTLLSVNTFGTAYDTVIYVRSVCDDTGTELDCSVGSNPHNLDLTDVPPGDYYLFADTADAADSGPWTIHVFGIIAPGQPCEPGDVVFRCDSATGQICSDPIGAGNVCNAGQCSDGFDNDADAIIDFPLDPGCTAPDDNTETDPVPPPECFNGADDDGDTLTDYPADPGCIATGDDLEIDDCITGVPLQELDSAGHASGFTSGVSNFDGTCTTPPSGPEVVYVFEVPFEADITITTQLPGTTMDTGIYVRSVCDTSSTELGCNDNVDPSGFTTASELNLAGLDAGDYYLFIDGMWGASGAYEVQVTGIFASGAPCDPVSTYFTCNTANGDLCQDPGTGYVCAPADCSDGADNDGDSLTDFPEEPGCTALADDDEVDPGTAPVCSNGLDDDGDSLTDWGADIGCFYAADDTEEDECAAGQPFTILPASGTFAGSISSFTSAYDGSCSATFCTSGDEHIFPVTVPGFANVTFSTDNFVTTMDTVIYLRSSCNDAMTEIACNDNGPFTFFGSAITQSLAPGTYFLFVDGNCGATGSYTLNVTGTILAGETCIIGSTMWTCTSGTTCMDPGTGPVCM